MYKTKLCAALSLITLLFLISGCKKNDSNAITPTYRTAAPGGPSGGNPNINTPVYIPPTNTTVPATNNSNLTVGTTGWSNLSCGSTNSLSLKSISGNTEILLQFASPPAVGTYTYNVVSVPGPMGCTIQIKSAPNQPTGIIWYGFTGFAVVTTNASGIYAVLKGPVRCRQSGYLFPIVTIDGIMGCN